MMARGGYGKAAPGGQEVVPASSQATGLGPGGGPGGAGGLGLGFGGLGLVLTGKEATMATPHWPGEAPGAPRLRTSLPQAQQVGG